MSDKDGNFLRFSEYTGWDRLKEERIAHTNHSACKSSMPTVKQACITTPSGITNLMWVGL